MARKKKTTIDEDRSKFLGIHLKTETKHSILAVLFFIVAVLFILAPFKLAGAAGDFLYRVLEKLFGLGYALIPTLFVFIGVSLFDVIDRPHVARSHILASVLFLLSGLGLIDIVKNASGGTLGNLVSWPFVQLFDKILGGLFLLALLATSLFILFDRRPNLKGFFARMFSSSSDEEAEEEYEEDEEEEEEEEPEPAPRPQKKKTKEPEPEEDLSIPAFGAFSDYTPPPFSLLKKDSGRPEVGDIKANANMIKRTLKNFGIDVEMDEVTVGPTVTRYALKPAEGVKLSRITALQNDLALALASRSIRIQAPIPGKSLVGIEIPNQNKATVGLRGLVESPDFRKSPKPLLMALGKGISGKAFYGNMAKMPHLLVAGATGAGKSVTVHGLISSLLYRNGPQDLRFIMIDPKRVELTLYNKIPHLLTPVITDPKKAIIALKWAVKEMERRYDVLESEQVRDIDSYRKKIAKEMDNYEIDDPNRPEFMPYIIVIIDELADIMTSYPRELESGIVRLAQMSRAVGIHLILSTQRPSVNVVTGLIKANVPSRIALQVASQVDSKTILDTAGAEKLLGAGDMLYSSGEMSQPERVQSAYISEDEVKSIVKYLKKQYEDELPDEINLGSVESSGGGGTIFDSGFGDDEEEDELYEDAREIVIHAGKASTSYLQRKLKIGYSRAARLMDILEERGVIGPANGSKPREVYEETIDNLEDDNDYEEDEDMDANEDSNDEYYEDEDEEDDE